VTRTRAELILLVALLGGAWLVVANGGWPSSSPDHSAPTGGITTLSPVGGGLPGRAAALRAYLATPRPREPVRRNPFSFREASPVGRADRHPAVTPRAAEPAPSRPEMFLSGIAEEAGTGHPLRTAMISVAGQLVFAREGDRVLSRFVVLRIAADAVQMKDAEGGEMFTLALR
jgi:hypothetical protein